MKHGNTLYPYPRGQQIVVRFAQHGTQLAEVVEDCGHKYAFSGAAYDYVRARKYSASARGWTKTVIRVPREEILGIALIRDMQPSPVPS